jgi:hypothetical protein
VVGDRRAVAAPRLDVVLVGLAVVRVVVRLVGVTLRAVEGCDVCRVVVGRDLCAVVVVVRLAVVLRESVLVATEGMVRRPAVVTPLEVGDELDDAANLRPAADVGT